MKKIFVAIFLCAFAFISTGIMAQPGKQDTPVLNVTDFMVGLQSPWELAFTDDGKMLFTEKCGGLSVRYEDGSVKRLFGIPGYAVEAPDFFCAGQSGMGGLAIDPDFKTNRLIYVFMASEESASSQMNHIVRLKVSDDFSTVTERTDIVKDIPFKAQANAWGAAGSHSGGRISFGPDGYLYITTGDNHNGTIPQDRKSLGGKVLRVDRNGAPPPDSITPAGEDPRIFTSGHRNPQGLAFRPLTGRAIIAEHGPHHSDEVTALTAGGNGGWDPVPDDGVTCEDNYCGYISNRRSGIPTPMTDLIKFPTAMRPFYVLDDSQGMGPAAFVNGSQWKDWDGALLVGVMDAKKLHVVHMGVNDELVRVEFANVPEERIRTIVQGPEGHLYMATDSGKILKITPQ